MQGVKEDFSGTSKNQVDFLKFNFLFNVRIITLQHRDGFYRQYESAMDIHMSPPSSTSLPPPSPSHPSRLSQSISFGFPVSYSQENQELGK